MRLESLLVVLPLQISFLSVILKILDMAVRRVFYEASRGWRNVKRDFLGLTTLTAVQICLNSIATNTGDKFQWIDLPFR